MEKYPLTQPGYRSRLVDARVAECLEAFGAVLLEGPKWCGKTWTALHHSNSAAYFGHETSGGQDSDYALANTDLNLVLNRESPELLDEWQDVPEIWDAVRHRCDTENRPGLYILTGSATPPRDEQHKIRHSGAGRICRLNMSTMSLYETGDSSGDVSLAGLFKNEFESKEIASPTLETLARFIVRGGWPAGLDRPLTATSLSEGYLEDVVNYDISAVDGVKRSPEKMRFLLRSLARNESTIASNKTLAQDIDEQSGLSKNTVTDYLNVLEMLHLLANQPAFSENARSPERIGVSPKRHFADPSLAAAALGLDVEGVMGDLRTFGFLFEALCEHDLRVYAESLGGTLRHYRNNVSGLEVDAIIELKNGDFGAVEIKLSANAVDEAAENLQKLSSELTVEPKFKAVICGLCSAAARRKDGIYVFPITALKN